MTKEELEGFFDLSEKPTKQIPGLEESAKSTTINIRSRSLDVLGKLLEQDTEFKDKKQSLKELCKSTSSMSYTYEDPSLLVYNANVFWKSQIPIEDLEELE